MDTASDLECKNTLKSRSALPTGVLTLLPVGV